MTHSYAILRLTPTAYAEIRAKLVTANYHHAIHRHATYPLQGEVLDMHGIAVQEERDETRHGYKEIWVPAPGEAI